MCPKSVYQCRKLPMSTLVGLNHYIVKSFFRWVVTTWWPTITTSFLAEVRSQFIHEIIQNALQYNIPNELIINIDQTSSKFVATDIIAMPVQSESMSHDAGQPIKAIIATLCESFDGVILPFQLIHTGKTERSLPNGFCFAFIENH